MNRYPFLPKTTEEAAERFGTRIYEFWQCCFDSTYAETLPDWVRKMGRALRDQTFDRDMCDAIDSRDEPSLTGFSLGAMIAVRHVLTHNPPDTVSLSLQIGRACAGKVSQTTKGSEPVEVKFVFDHPEITKALSSIFTELHAETHEARCRFLEGMKAGNNVELIMRNGPLRPGLANDTQFMMLLFWPEIEAMATRKEAYNFIQFMFQETPSAQRGEEAFVRFAKDYGFKSRKASREDTSQGASPYSAPP